MKMKTKATVLLVLLLGAAISLGALNTKIAVLREIYHSLAGDYQVSGGTAALATTTDTAVTCLTVGSGHTVYHARVTNGATAGFVSFDSGTTWQRLPANTTVSVDGIKLIAAGTIQVKRVAGGSDLADVYAAAWGG